MNAKPRTSHAKRSLYLVMVESSITAGLLSMSIMTLFFYSVGLNQAEIAASQSIFTIVVALLNFPTGWVADRFSRKWANVIGDFGFGAVCLFYAFANNFFDVVLAECLLAVFNSLSQGVDFALLKHFSQQIAPGDESYFYQQSARLSFAQNLCSLVIVLLGGPIGAISFRLAIALSSVTYFVGGLASLFIVDDSKQLVNTSRSPIGDMCRIAKFCMTTPKLRLYILAFAFGREMTHVIIWVFTPMLIAVGMPVAFTPIIWALNSLTASLGSFLASKLSNRLKPWQKVSLALCFLTVSLLPMSISLNLLTIWFYLFCGITQGWTGATLTPLIQSQVPDTEQTSVISLAKVISQALYALTVYVVGIAADVGLQFAALATLMIFVPAGALISYHLSKE